ncbi:hypothetical protein U2P60_02310 [Brucella sp. H1_1004]|uniref:hypothetical protein n=1 Tax=Brucella sp. H1_1004 TaxID=3110109 RepID=UPI0039B5DDAA
MKSFKAQHMFDDPLYKAMILFKNIVQGIAKFFELVVSSIDLASNYRVHFSG